MTAPTSPVPQAPLARRPVAHAGQPMPSTAGSAADPLPADPLPLPQPGWGEQQARHAVAEAALVLPALDRPALLVRAVSTVVFQVGECAVKVHPPGSDPSHLARVHALLRESPVAVTAALAPVVTSHGVVTLTPWHPPQGTVDWADVGQALHRLHALPAATALPAWTPLRRLPAQLEHLPPPYAAVLANARARVLDRLVDLSPVLPAGVLHGDVAPDNLLRTATGPRWVDLDFACAGPREYDLSAVLRRHAAGALSDAQYRGFVRAYGEDLRGWPGLALLDEVCALSGLGFRLWTDRCAGRPSSWLPGELARLSARRAGR